MTPAEVKVLRESLGLSTGWLARRLEFSSDRHLRAIEAGKAPVSVKLTTLLHELEAHAESLADSHLDMIASDAGVDLDSIEDLDEADWPTLAVPRVDEKPPGEFPASFYRAVAARVRWELGGQCWIEYS